MWSPTALRRRDVDSLPGGDHVIAIESQRSQNAIDEPPRFAGAVFLRQFHCLIDACSRRNIGQKQHLIARKPQDIAIHTRLTLHTPPGGQFGKRGIDFGSQIRTYTLHPYQLVKDERTRYETGNIQAVLDGDLDGLNEAFLQWRRSGN